MCADCRERVLDGLTVAPSAIPPMRNAANSGGGQPRMDCLKSTGVGGGELFPAVKAHIADVASAVARNDANLGYREQDPAMS
jgi:hypothetical protein